MGYDMKMICVKCGAVYQMFMREGYCFPQIYQWAVETIQLGKRGKEWKELLEKTPHAAVNCDKHLYVCDACDRFLVRQDLSIYVPIDPEKTSLVHNEPYTEDFPAVGMEYALPIEIYHYYRLVKQYVHPCPECKNPLHRYRGEVLLCPKCGERAVTWEGIPLWAQTPYSSGSA